MDIPADFATLWDDVSRIAVPVLLVRGGAPGTVVDDGDETELRRRQPGVRVETVEGAGHSIQGDRPLELAALLRDFQSA
jgi:pimeloyl-ACP methyl ester carboxylesterase